MTTLNTRIAQLRRTLGVTQQELGGLAGGVSKAAVSAWERSETQPSAESQQALYANCGVSLDWLQRGQGEMFVQPGTEAGPALGFEGLSPRSRSLIGAILDGIRQGRLSEEDLALLVEMAQRLEQKGAVA